MSIEKLDFVKVKSENLPFTIILNSVIQDIKDSESFMVWAYLYSHSGDWSVIKVHLKEKYKFGDVKLRKIFSYLHRCKLTRYDQIRNISGQVNKWNVIVMSGYEFDKNIDFIDPVSSKSEINPVVKSPLGQLATEWVNHTDGFGALLKKEYTKENKNLLQKKIKEKREKISLPLDFFPDDETLQFLIDQKIDRDMYFHSIDKFKEYYKGGYVLDRDWQKRFRVWILREKNHKEMY